MMKNMKRVALIAAVLALSAATVFASAVLAQGPDPANPAAPDNAQANRCGRNAGGTGTGYGLAVRGAWGGPEHSLVAIAAEVLDMEQADLVAELQSSKTLAQVAEANNVDLQDIVEAFLAPRVEILTQAVADGKITQADADAILAHMDETATEKMTGPWESHGNGTCDGTCTGLQGQQMRGGQRQGIGMAGQGAQYARMGRGMGGRWQ